MKINKKAENIMIDSAKALRLLAESAIKTNAPKVFIEHLAKACNEINNAYEIWRYGNDNQGSD